MKLVVEIDDRELRTALKVSIVVAEDSIISLIRTFVDSEILQKQENELTKTVVRKAKI